MELTAAFILIASVIGIAAYAGTELALRARLRKQTVIVVLKGDVYGSSGPSWRGVLWRQTPRHIILLGAEFLEGEGAVPSDGLIVLPRSNIAWIQRPEEL
jgi:hypothetical protein